MATFRCEAHLAAVAAACGYRVRVEGSPQCDGDGVERPFRVELKARGLKAKKEKKDLTEAAFELVLDPSRVGCCGSLMKKKRPVAHAVAVFGLTGESRRLERAARKRGHRGLSYYLAV